MHAVPQPRDEPRRRFGDLAGRATAGGGDGVALVAQLQWPASSASSHGRLDVEAVLQPTAQFGLSTADQHLQLRLGDSGATGRCDRLPAQADPGGRASERAARASVAAAFGAPHAARRRSCPVGAYPADLRAMRQEHDQDGAAASDASSDPAADSGQACAAPARDVTTNRGPGKPQRATGATPNAISGLATNPS